jgi:hypothetical protein
MVNPRSVKGVKRSGNAGFVQALCCFVGCMSSSSHREFKVVEQRR